MTFVGPVIACTARIRGVVLIVAVIGLVGTLAASGAVSEWLRRRDLREAIKIDLEIWEKLPDGEAKSRLMARVERQLDGLQPDVRRKVRRTMIANGFAAAIMLIAVHIVQWINGGFEWIRGADGILRMHTPDGTWTTFLSFVFKMMGAIYVFVLVVPLMSMLTTPAIRLFVSIASTCLGRWREFRRGRSGATSSSPASAEVEH